MGRYVKSHRGPAAGLSRDLFAAREQETVLGEEATQLGASHFVDRPIRIEMASRAERRV